ncbi:MAG: winged helix-turn-helix transcriptional regulator [Bacteroidetes bacterium]|nr:MAG: winged helix-turn-helix transcriptional regulator [Bacteroidota bacterium]
MNLRRDVFQAIADPTRRSILILLASQTMTAGAIAEKFNTARPTISKHIQILTQCGLVDSTQQGREIHYQLRLDKLSEVDVWVEQIKKIWEQRFDDLDKYLEQIQSKAK